MHHEQTMARSLSVPSFLLMVLEQIVFIVVLVIVNDVSHRVLFDIGHIVDCDGRVQLLGLEPAAEPALVGGVACRAEAVAVVAAIVHNAPGIHAEVTA